MNMDNWTNDEIKQPRKSPHCSSPEEDDNVDDTPQSQHQRYHRRQHSMEGGGTALSTRGNNRSDWESAIYSSDSLRQQQQPQQYARDISAAPSYAYQQITDATLGRYSKRQKQTRDDYSYPTPAACPSKPSDSPPNDDRKLPAVDLAKKNSPMVATGRRYSISRDPSSYSHLGYSNQGSVAGRGGSSYEYHHDMSIPQDFSAQNMYQLSNADTTDSASPARRASLGTSPTLPEALDSSRFDPSLDFASGEHSRHGEDMSTPYNPTHYPHWAHEPHWATAYGVGLGPRHLHYPHPSALDDAHLSSFHAYPSQMIANNMEAARAYHDRSVRELQPPVRTSPLRHSHSSSGSSSRRQRRGSAASTAEDHSYQLFLNDLRNMIRPTDAELEASPNDRARQALETWYDRFHDLRAYRVEHGDCDVPQKYGKNQQLGVWVNKQRMLKKDLDEGKQTSLTAEKLAHLASVGFKWGKRKGAASWESKYQALVQYYNRHGNSDVPTKYAENPALGRWVSTQRSEYKSFMANGKSQLNEDRIRRLTSVDFTWDMTERGDL